MRPDSIRSGTIEFDGGKRQIGAALMTAEVTIVALTMAGLSRIPEHCRTCVCWEVEPAAAAGLGPADRAFEKEAWLSGIMLTWGSAGLLATAGDRTAGYAQFAPPTATPGAAAFPSGPVSPDAVLLTTIRAEPAFTGAGVAGRLIAESVAALSRRRVRAIEAFGSRRPGPDPAMPCVIPADLLQANGFEVVRAHPEYPRLRYELEPESDWKAEVEAALESLLADAAGFPTSAARVAVG